MGLYMESMLVQHMSVCRAFQHFPYHLGVDEGCAQRVVLTLICCFSVLAWCMDMYVPGRWSILSADTPYIPWTPCCVSTLLPVDPLRACVVAR